MKRLLFINPQSYNNLAIYDTSLLRYMEGYEIHYYCNRKYQCWPLDHVTYHKIFDYSDKKGVCKGLSYVASILGIVCAAARLRPDVVHIQWFRLFEIDAVLVWWLNVLHIPVVHTAHNVLPHIQKKGDKKHYAWFYGHVDKIIVHTRSSKAELLSVFPQIPSDRVEVVAHGLIEPMFASQDIAVRAAELASGLQCADKIVFACMGYQNYYKGIDLVTEVWLSHPELRDNPDVMLLIVGKSEQADLHALAQCRNVYIDDQMVPDIDFEAYLQSVSVMLLPYRRISQSGVLMTAVQRGIPVVVSDVGGLTEPLQVGDVGWNIGAPTVDNLSRILVQLAKNPGAVSAKRKAVGEFDKVRGHYSWQKIAARTASLYQGLQTAE